MARLKARVMIMLFMIPPILLGGWMLMSSEKDAQQYHDLVNQSQAARTAKKNPYIATQYREGVIKDIYFLSGHLPMKARVSSDSSRLVFDQQPGGMEILEHMEKMTCVMQKELFYVSVEGDEFTSDGKGRFKNRKGKYANGEEESLLPMQIVRYVTADKATYYYNKEKLIADEPTIVEYRIDGHELPEHYDSASLTMRGVAEAVEISFLNGELAFQAKRLKARFLPKGGNE